MKHSTIIKAINKTFLENWFGIECRLDTNDDISNETNPFISLRYQGNSTDRKFLTEDLKGLVFSGTLRVYIYNINPTKSYETMDEIVIFLRNKIYNNILFTELDNPGFPVRANNSDLYTSFIDFNCCLIN